MQKENESVFVEEQNINSVIRNRYLFIFDIFIIVLAFFATGLLVQDVYQVVHNMLHNFVGIIVTAVVYVSALYISGAYNTLWIHAGVKDYIKLSEACLIAGSISIVADRWVLHEFYFKYLVCTAGIASIGIVVIRMSVRVLNEIYRNRVTSTGDKTTVLIVGAGAAASIVIKDIANNRNLNYDIVGFVDDDPTKKNIQFNGVKVLGDRFDIPKLCRQYAVDEILIAMPSAPQAVWREIVEIASKTKCKIKTLPSVDQMIDEDNLSSKIRNVQIEDLLARDTIELDNSGIGAFITGKVVLVTGGGGSIGSELCRQIMKYSPQTLVVLDIYENSAYELQMELNRQYPDNKPEVIIASVRDMDRLESVFEKYRPYIVFHAAAHKHVPLMEVSPGEAVKNNIFGTLNVAKCADKFGVKRFVMISTDKAVNPTNVMGATKRFCEMIVQCMQQDSQTEFVAVRFGNVLGSNGSVIPLFKRQIEAGGPVTVTDKRITRYFMTIPEACQLVLQAASYAKGGEVFVLDMGEPVKIYDLAKNLIRLSGYRPDIDIEIVEVGLRPGEKLYEELLMDEEGLKETAHRKIFIGKPAEVDRQQIQEKLEILRAAVETGNPETVKQAMEQVVDTYKRKD